MLCSISEFCTSKIQFTQTPVYGVRALNSSVVDPAHGVKASEKSKLALGLGNRYNSRIGKRKPLECLIRIVFSAEYS